MPSIAGWFSTKEAVGGAPRWLFTFARANRVWRLTSSDAPVVVTATGLTYEPALITRDRIERTQEIRADTIAVKVARTSAIADALREVTTHPMALRIEKYQPGDALAVPIREAFGDVANVRLEGYGWIAFDLVIGEHRFGEAFPTKLVERQCQWPAFSAESGIDERSYAFTTTLTAIAGTKVTVASLGLGFTGYYNSGQMKFGSDASAERVFIDYHVGRDLYVVGQLPASVLAAYAAFLLGGPAVPVTLIPGDDKTLKTRRDVFGAVAVDRFIGFDLLPTTDPLQTGVTNAPVNLTPYADAPAVPAISPSGGLPLRIFPSLAETDSDATVRLTLSDPDARFVLFEWRSNPTGFAADWSAWDTMPVDAFDGDGNPIAWAGTATKGAGGYVAIEVRTTYLDDASAEQTVNSVWEFSRPFYETARLVPNIDVPGELVLSQFFAGSAWMRAFLTLTGAAQLWANLAYRNQKARIFIDATGGPFTLTLRPTDAFGAPQTHFVEPGAVAVTAFDVDGSAVIEVERLYSDALDWTIITGSVTPI